MYGRASFAPDKEGNRGGVEHGTWLPFHIILHLLQFLPAFAFLSHVDSVLFFLRSRKYGKPRFSFAVEMAVGFPFVVVGAGGGREA